MIALTKALLLLGIATSRAATSEPLDRDQLDADPRQPGPAPAAAISHDESSASGDTVERVSDTERRDLAEPATDPLEASMRVSSGFAAAVLAPVATGSPHVTLGAGRGTARLISEADATAAGSAIRIAILVAGMPPGDHGLAIHERGDCSGVRAAAAGGHWNPTGERHGGPHDKTRHLGDLGNLHVGADGRGVAVLRFRFVRDERGDAQTAIIGKALVVSERADDLKTDPDGDAGPALACGVIERTDAVAH